MKKKLLSEAQVRRFMGLAGINPLNEMAHNMSEEDLEERVSKKDDEEMREMRGDMKKDNMREEEEEMDMDKEGGAADVEIDEEDIADVKSALDTLQDKLAPLLDQAEGGEAMDDEEPADDMAMDDEEPADDMDMGGDEEEEDEDMDAELQEVMMELSEDEIVNEVARRVAKRIVEAKRAHKKMNEALGRKR